MAGEDPILNRKLFYDDYLHAEYEATQLFLSDPISFQSQALSEAAAAGQDIRVPESGIFDIALNVKIIEVREKETVQPPAGCISKQEVVAIARGYNVSPIAVGVAWTRLTQRVAHTIRVSGSGELSPEQQERLDRLKQAGVRIYEYEWHTGDRSITYYTFRDETGNDLEILKLADGIEEDTPYHDENERFLVADSFVKAVDQGLLEHIDDEVVYKHGLGPKFKRLFYSLADRLREDNTEETVKLTLGYSDIDDFKTFAEQNDISPGVVSRIERVIRIIANEEGMVSQYVIEHGEKPTVYRDFLDSDATFGGPNQSEVANIELIAPDGKINMDTVKDMCYRGSFKKYASRMTSYGDKADSLVWGVLDQKRKEALESLK